MIISFLNQKGGVGKTTLSGNVAFGLHLRGYKVVLVDSDPQQTTLTWNNIRSGDNNELPFNAIATSANSLKQLTERMITKDGYDYVVIDGEAGIEQINRRVMEKVTHLLLVTDASKKGCQVVQTIKKVADELVMYDRIGVIANRIPDMEVAKLMDIGDLELLSVIQSDSKLAQADVLGENVFNLPDDAIIVEGAKKALVNMGIL